VSSVVRWWILEGPAILQVHTLRCYKYIVTGKTILVVDDEPDLVELVSYNLRKEGFEISSASDGETALRKIRGGRVDLVVLDLMLPGIQGMELCRILRKDPKTESLPIIMVTAKGEEVDRVLGLESGADDYIAKPFSPRELVARVRAVMRRVEQKQPGGKAVRIGDLFIDSETYSVSKGNRLLDLSATEFRLLLFLVERKGKVFSRNQLLDAVWKDEAFVEPRTVDVHIRRLRTQIEDDPSTPKYIKTKRGIGYYVEPSL
jgi:phosphate regulon transcriptional regulator PhoB